MNKNGLTGDALNRAVHEALGYEPIKSGCSAVPYSTDWYFGGPVLEQGGIDITGAGNAWVAKKFPWKDEYVGDTRLVAIMRCFVGQKLNLKIKTSELVGAQLDWAVAKCEGKSLVDGCLFTKDPDDEQVLYSPSTDWAQAGPIIERERLNVYDIGGDMWACDDNLSPRLEGPTFLVAAMRCYVSASLGDAVELPKELT